MSRVASFLVRNHWELVKVAFPCSVAFGFVYTMNFGSSPLADAKKNFAGEHTEAKRLRVVETLGFLVWG